MRKEVIGNATLYLGDCLELSIEHDLLLVDPPYGKDFESGKAGGKWGKIAGDAACQQGYVIERLAHALKGLKRGRHVYIFGPTDLTSLTRDSTWAWISRTSAFSATSLMPLLNAWSPRAYPECAASNRLSAGPISPISFGCV